MAELIDTVVYLQLPQVISMRACQLPTRVSNNTTVKSPRRRTPNQYAVPVL